MCQLSTTLFCFQRFLCAGLLLVVAAVPAYAADTVYNVTEDGIAIGGYDPVAYALNRQPAQGVGEYSFEWNGATWQFASKSNLELFRSDPVAYAPAYGGWCAMGMAGGSVVEVDFEHGWSYVGGRVYLNVSKDINTRWRRAANRMIRRADGHWPDVEPTILSGEAYIHRRASQPVFYQ